MNEENKDSSIKITLRDIYEILKDTQKRVVDLEARMLDKMETDGIPNDIDNLKEQDIKLEKKIGKVSDNINSLETKIDNHLQRTEGLTEGTDKTNTWWIKILALIISLLGALQIIDMFWVH